MRSDLGCWQFFITTAKCDFLDGKHVVFGKVIDGMLTLRKIENVQTGPNNRPKLAVKITGEVLSLSCPALRLVTPMSRMRGNVMSMMFYKCWKLR